MCYVLVYTVDRFGFLVYFTRNLLRCIDTNFVCLVGYHNFVVSTVKLLVLICIERGLRPVSAQLNDILYC